MNELMIISNIVLIIIIVGMGFFIKYFFPSYFNEKGKNLATKEDIAEITEKIESVKTVYDKSLLKFSTYHKNQAKVIAKLYKFLVQALDNMFLLTAPDMEKLKQANNSISDFLKYYKNHRIYLDSALKEKIESINQIMRESYIDFEMSKVEGLDRKEKSEYLKSAYDKINKQAHPILEELENIFRNLLSV